MGGAIKRHEPEDGEAELARLRAELAAGCPWLMRRSQWYARLASNARHLSAALQAEFLRELEAYRLAESSGRLAARHVGTIDDWMAIAVRGLCHEVRTRIEDEIRAHYLDAYDAHIGDGKTQAAAAVAALESLGDPYSANRTYKRLYLTDYEARVLANMLDGRLVRQGFPIASNFGFGLAVLLDVAIGSLLFGPIPWTAWLRLGVVTCGIVLVPYLSACVAPAHYRAGRYRLWSLTHILTGATYAAVLLAILPIFIIQRLWLSEFAAHAFVVTFVTAVGTILVGSVLQISRLGKKLSRNLAMRAR